MIRKSEGNSNKEEKSPLVGWHKSPSCISQQGQSGTDFVDGKVYVSDTWAMWPPLERVCVLGERVMFPLQQGGRKKSRINEACRWFHV